MKLPSGPWAPARDAAGALAEATSTCRGITTLSAEVGVSGSIGGQGIHGRLLVGLASPASARVEAVAPFGQPVFIFVARAADATLLLPRDDRVLEHGKPEALLETVTGVPLDAASLRTTLTACPLAPDIDSGRSSGDGWRVIADGSTEVYLRRESPSTRWSVAAMVHRGSGAAGDAAWRAEYADLQNGLPRTVRLVSADTKRFALRLTLSQLEINTALDAEVFRVQVPRTATPISLQELKAAGPLRNNAGRAGGHEPPSP
ncbi:MAG TPA: hypothetical protein VGY48_31210 [Vicinamibacterales bacterium]|jgi:hypothetical protein|nr:hypothetical protein [Vicinamibacterales bacterium]